MWGACGLFLSGHLYLHDKPMARLLAETEHSKQRYICDNETVLCVQNIDLILGSIINTIASMGPIIIDIN